MVTAATQTLAERWYEGLASAEGPEGPDWLLELREGAIGSFTTHGLPHRKVEAWKYTPLKRLEDRRLDLSGEPGEPDTAGFEPPILPNAETIVDVVDGALPPVLPQAPQGVAITPFAGALHRFDARLEALAAKMDLAGPAHAFSALNTACLHRGLVVHVSAGVDGGTLLLRLGTSKAAEDRITPFRLFVLLDQGARIELVEQYSGNEAPAGALNLVVQAQLGEKAGLDHVRIQGQQAEAVLITRTDVEQASESRYTYRGFDLGGGLVRHELNAELAGDGATADLAGACVLDGSRHGDSHVSVDHAAPGCSSEQFFRSVLGGRSRGVYNGRALIREGADGSSVQQSNANLLLSPLAEMDTKPELEIYADEVEASHGATVGQLDETAVFYLRSRGLAETEARRVLTAAFCHAVTARLENRPLAEKIGEMIDAAMPEAT